MITNQVFEKPICIREINENLNRVKLGMELTRPLRQLNTHCEFKKKYKEWCDIEDRIEHFEPKILNCESCDKKFKQKYHQQICCSKKCSKAKMRKYQQTPEYKAKMREYQQTPEYKAKKREYMRKKLNIKPENYRTK